MKRCHWWSHEYTDLLVCLPDFRSDQIVGGASIYFSACSMQLYRTKTDSFFVMHAALKGVEVFYEWSPVLLWLLVISLSPPLYLLPVSPSQLCVNLFSSILGLYFYTWIAILSDQISVCRYCMNSTVMQCSRCVGLIRWCLSCLLFVGVNSFSSNSGSLEYR